MAPKPRNMFYENKRQETTEIPPCKAMPDCLGFIVDYSKSTCYRDSYQLKKWRNTKQEDPLVYTPSLTYFSKVCLPGLILWSRLDSRPRLCPSSAVASKSRHHAQLSSAVIAILNSIPNSNNYRMTERMDSWNPPESWKRITCIMMNTVKTIRHELESCNGDYEDAARRKIPSRRSDCVRTAEFLANLQERGLKNPAIGIRALSREMNVAASTMKLALDEDLRYYSYKRRKGQLLTEEAREKA
ncbi:hypothetical protein AAG570_004983 [Ranatra chinensis]|uniref:Uncharacterized protein n=1 Tax=Ranatra chinensis TaxID=642074 RepID=A0ABD0XZ53_9HEMI